MGRPKEILDLEQVSRASGRLPPGQTLTHKWPVLHEGPIPKFDPATWDLRILGAVERPLRFTWKEFLALPQVDLIADMHCVTTWSTFDNVWTGVALKEIVQRAGIKPNARFLIAHAEGDYTTNMLLDPALASEGILAHSHNHSPLTPEHGYPLRLVIPKLYAWKSAKWLRGLEFSDQDKPGFWEVRGYSNGADPWHEQRYSDDD
jgi:DMSO/TMAO reductase YedYZ molybdopterin-dependent catalytic subunit